MAERLIVHIGDYKTGSTALQSVLASREVRINGERILYPGGSRDHIWLANSLMAPQQRKPVLKRIDKLARKIVESDAAIAILSAEHFATLGPMRLKAWLDATMTDQSVEVIGYARPHAEYVLSSYAERVKLGIIPPDFEAYVEKLISRNRLLLVKRYRVWRKVFGDRFTLRPMVRSALTDGDIVADFLTVTGRGAAFEAPPPTLSNASLGLEDLHFLARAQEVLADSSQLIESQKRRYGNKIQRALLDDPPKIATRLLFRPNQLERLRTAFAKDAAKLDATYFEGTPMSDAMAAADRLAAPDAVQTVSSGSTLRQAWALRKLTRSEALRPLLAAVAMRRL